METLQSYHRRRVSNLLSTYNEKLVDKHFLMSIKYLINIHIKKSVMKCNFHAGPAAKTESAGCLALALKNLNNLFVIIFLIFFKTINIS